MSYKEVLEQYKGKFTNLLTSNRVLLLRKLFVELKDAGFSRSDLNDNIDSIIALVLEGCSLQGASKDNLNYFITYMIGAEGIIFDHNSDEIQKVVKAKEPEQINSRIDSYPDAIWDYEYMKELGMEHPDE